MDCTTLSSLNLAGLRNMVCLICTSYLKKQCVLKYYEIDVYELNIEFVFKKYN